jgi:hypothetical protein
MKVSIPPADRSCNPRAAFRLSKKGRVAPGIAPQRDPALFLLVVILGSAAFVGLIIYSILKPSLMSFDDQDQ